MSSLLEKMLKTGAIKGESLDKSKFFGLKNITKTEIPIINLALMGKLNGGLVPGITTIAGPSKCFKSLLGLYCMKAFLEQNEDGVALLYDSEYGITPQYLESRGIDTARVVHLPIDDVEQLKFDMIQKLKEIKKGEKVFVMIDSAGNLASRKEVEDAENEKSVVEMQRAKVFKSLWRMVTPHLKKLEIPCVVIQHSYKEIGSMYPKDIVSGGTGLVYSSDTVFLVSKAQEKEGTEIVGWNFTINIDKSRFVREKAKFTFNARYDTGVNKWSGLFNLAEEFGFIEKVSSGWYTIVDPATGEINDTKQRESTIEKNDDFFKKLLQNKNFLKEVEDKYSMGSPELADVPDDLPELDVNIED